MTTNTQTKKLSRSLAIAADVAALIRARNPLLWIVTREEARVEALLIEAASKAGYIPRTWDCAQGIADINGKVDSSFSDGLDPEAVLTTIGNRANAKRERGAWIMRDLVPWLNGPIGMKTVRRLRNLARSLPGVERDGAQTIIVLTPIAQVPEELQGHAMVVEWPLPDREEIANVLDAAIRNLPDEIRDSAAPNGTREAAIDAAVGLSGEEAAACYAKSIIQSRKIDPVAVAQEKKRVIARERVLEWFDPLPGGLDSVGGLENLKAWLKARSSAYSPAARAFGLPSPKGVVLVGVAGCGKSLTAKAVSTAWQIPLLKMDFGAMKSKFVGDSEQTIRKAFNVIEAIGRCVVWIDEIEKQLQGATSGSADGGVSADALGSFLSWMQERKGEAFVIATSNDVRALPPELLRKGRFDEIFFVDTPTAIEREAVLSASLRSFDRDAAELAIDLKAVAKASEGFTGAEIAALVPDALFAAFSDMEREITTDDLLNAAATVTPLTKQAAEKIGELREWAKAKARRAGLADDDTSASRVSGRLVDL